MDDAVLQVHQRDAMAAFTHVRIILGMVLGLAVSRLLVGVSRFIQHPHKFRIYPAHLVWVAFLLAAIVRFWWFEFHLRNLPYWTFVTYLFVVFYASLYFLLSALLFPDSMEEYAGYGDYFRSRRVWFFGILMLLFSVDILDTWLKGADYLASLGVEYFAHCFAILALSVAGMVARRDGHQLVIALAALLVLVVFTLRHFVVLG